MIRLYLALFGVLLVLAGHATHTPGVLVVGLGAVLPLLAKVLAWPKPARAGFVLSAVVAGLLLAGFAAGQGGGTGVQARPVSAACVAGVAR